MDSILYCATQCLEQDGKQFGTWFGRNVSRFCGQDLGICVAGGGGADAEVGVEGRPSEAHVQGVPRHLSHVAQQLHLSGSSPNGTCSADDVDQVGEPRKPADWNQSSAEAAEPGPRLTTWALCAVLLHSVLTWQCRVPRLGWAQHLT